MKKYLLAISLILLTSSCSTTTPIPPIPRTQYKSAKVLGKKIFYREAGEPKKKTLILLHGYPSSSHTYRELIPMLSPYFHIIAPDYLGSGYSDRPDPNNYRYTFDKLSEHVGALIEHLQIKEYVLYMQDFGAPVGFRLMMKNPEKIIGIISQNANAYLEGLTEKRQEFFLKANKDRSDKQVAKMENWVKKKAIIEGQYLRDIPQENWKNISPDAWTHDLNFLKTPQDRKIQVHLFQDYQNNIDQYPKWQSLLRKHQFPALIIWGKHDAAFIAEGAKAYQRDLPKAKLVLLDAGHFAVEEKAFEIATHVYEFMYSL